MKQVGIGSQLQTEQWRKIQKNETIDTAKNEPYQSKSAKTNSQKWDIDVKITTVKGIFG